jgi:hypothetical protein
MNQYDGVLRMYADSGLRTIEDWAILGRDIASGVKPRLDTPHRGGTLSLYSRGQTHPRPRLRPDLH